MRPLLFLEPAGRDGESASYQSYQFSISPQHPTMRIGKK